MKIQTLPRQIQAFPADALIVSHTEGSDKLAGPAASLDVALGASDGVPGTGPISKLLALKDFGGKPNELAVLYTNGLIPAARVILVGLGKAADLSAERVRQASGVAVRKAQELGCARVATVVHGAGSGGLNTREAAQATVEGALLGAYQFNEFRTSTAAKSAIADLAVLEPAHDRVDDARAGATTGEVLANAQNAARDLINRPPDVLNPTSLAAWCVAMSKRVGLKCTVIGLAEMRKLGMGGVIGVCQGSKHAPQFVVLEHKPAKAPKTPPVIFVGKGVTFDTGGYSIKSNDGMVGMKGDMAGAAAVMGAMQALAQLKVNRHVIGITPLVENMISAEAFRPNDVLRMMNGMTVEITSTDAEGRLILADALHYAKRFKPQRVVDLATLTGTASIAMGRGLASTVHANSDAWAGEIASAGARAGERVWHMPIWPEHLERMRSDTADLKNGAQDMYAGLGSSAAFIREFTLNADGSPAYDWAHLDMAAMSLTKEVRGYQPKGGMGFGVRTLVNLAM